MFDRHCRKAVCKVRRKDKEITDPRKIEAVLKKAEIIHIALLDGERPYIVPLNYGYAENTIIRHSSIDILHSKGVSP